MQDVPYGFCHCGCGERTPVSPITRNERGYRKGDPIKYIHGHNGTRRERYEVRDCGYETPCWVWLLGTYPSGYAHAGRYGLAHRLYYERHVGPIADGLQLDHLCRNRACVNPAHLEPVTPAENQHRRVDLALDADRARQIKGLIRGGWRQADIARAYGVSQQLVCDIKKSRAWREA